MSLGDIVVTLSLEDGKFTSKVDVASKKLDEFTRRARQNGDAIDGSTRSVRRWGTGLRDAIIVMGLANEALHNINTLFFGMPRAIIRANAEIENMTVLMRGMSRETESFAAANRDAEQTVESLFRQAAQSPFSIQSLTDSMVKLKAAGVDPLARSQRALVDATAKYGGSGEQLKRASIAIQQMAGKGVISMEELRQQLAEAIPDAVPMMARALNVGMNDMIKAISTGRLQAGPAIEALFQQMELEAQGSAAVFAETWDGTMNRLKTGLMQTAVEIGDAGFMDAMKDSVSELTDLLVYNAEFAEAARELGQALTIVVDGLAGLVTLMVEYRSQIGTVITAFVALKAVMALKGPILELRKYAGTLSGEFSDALKKARNEQTLMFGEMRKGKVAFTGTNADLQKLNSSMMQYRARASAIATVSRTVATSVASIAGPMAIATAAIWAATYAYDKLIGDKKRLAEINEQEADSLGKASIQLLENNRDKLFETYLDIEKKMASGMTTEWTAGPNGQMMMRVREMTEAELEALKERSARLEVEIRETTKRINAALTGQDRRAVDMMVGQIERDIAPRVGTVASQFKAAEAALAEEMVKSYGANYQRIDEAAAEYQDRKAKLVESRNQAMAELYEAEKAELRKTMEGFDRDNPEDTIGGRTLAQFEATIDKINEKIAEIKNTRAPQVSFDEIMGGLDGDKVKLTPLESLINRYKEGMAELSAGVSNANVVLAEFNARAAAGAFADEAQEDIDAAREVARAYGEQKMAAEALKDSEQSRIEVTRTLANMARESSAALNDENPYLKAGSAAEKHRVKIEALIETNLKHIDTLRGTGQEGGEAFQTISRNVEALKKNLAQVDALQRDLTFAGIKQFNRELSDDFKTQSELETEAFERRRAQLLAVLATQKDLTAAQRQIILQTIELDRRLTKMGAIEKMMRSWQDSATGFKDAWAGAMDSFSSQLDSAIDTGKADLNEWAEEILKSIAKVVVRALIAKAVMAGIGMFNGGGQAGSNISDYTGDSFKDWGAGQTAAFANGGIMTNMGPVPLRKYAMGGIADRPQLALFGEGSTPEAYVPLPDGRTIPVTMTGGGGMPNVTVNVINQSGQKMEAEQRQPRFDQDKMVMDVVLKNASRPGPFRDVLRRGG